METTATNPTATATSGSAGIVASIRAATLASADRVEILRALRDTLPSIVPPDPQPSTRMRAAARIDRRFVDTAITGLTASDVWQKSAATTSDEVQGDRDFEQEKSVLDELTSFREILTYSLRYHHWQATEKSRVAYHVGKKLGGDEGLMLKPHLEIMARLLPQSRRKAVTPPAPPVETPAT